MTDKQQPERCMTQPSQPASKEKSMTDKQTPTDAELKAMWQLHAVDIGGIFHYARAVLAKWGTPAPVGAEPVALLVRKNSWRDGQWEAAPPNSPSYGLAWAHQRVYVYTTPQPTQAQAGAVPLTDDPDCGGESCDCRSYCKRKGGQHGAESST